MIQRTHYVPNGEGWLLALKQTYVPDKLRPDWRPVAIVPGYGMNAFIFGYHPTGASMEAFWAEKGFEVWSLNLRAQGGSKRVGGRRRYGFQEAGVTDLGCALDYVVRHTETKTDRVDGVGCSLGGTYLYVYLAIRNETSRLGSVVAMGAPLRWVEIHPALKAVFSSPALLGQVRFRGTRHLAKAALPLLKRIPKLLHLYMHPDIVDTAKMGEMVMTVEDPNPVLNRQLAEWIRTGDIYMNGVNVSMEVAAADNPLLVVLANADGIVPDATALSAYDLMGSSTKDVLRVGTEAVPVAHADLFVSDISHEWVFEPLAEWLAARNQPPPLKRTVSRSRNKGVKKTGRKKAKGSPARSLAAKKGTARPKKKSAARRKGKAG